MYMEASGVAQQIGSVQSGIAVANTAAGEVTVSVELTNLQGTPLGLPAATLTVPAGGQVTKFINELFPGLAGNFRGIARLTASSYVAVVALRGRYNERGDFLITTTPPLNETAGSSADVIFPHIVNGAGYTTQLTIFGDPGAGRVYLFGQDGTPKSSSSLTLQQ
jgi:hypothetical protein